MTKTREKVTETDEKKSSIASFVGGTADARAYRRRSVLWPAKLKVGRHDFNCQIWNMSLGGARVRLDMPIKEGVDVVLSIVGRGDIPAAVCWSEDSAAGLEFKVSVEEVRVMFMDRLQTLGLELPVA